jgi:4-aminobutyrate aminotransferase-like enzyme
VSLTTSNPVYHYKFQPLMPGVFVAPYPNRYYDGWTEAETEMFCLKQLRHLLASQTAPEETAAVLIEPVQGEGGYVVPTPGFLSGVQAICREHGIVFVVDEVQTGLGRTVKWFGFEHFGVEPDVVLMAKALASGFPLSAMVAREALMDQSPVGSQGGTFGGNAVACAAAVATLRAMREEGLIENSARMGARLKESLVQLQSRYPVIGDVRGLGLMVGVELTTASGAPDKMTATAVRKRCLDGGLILLPCGTYGNVIRFIPPLVIDDSQLGDALSIFERALKATTA